MNNVLFSIIKEQTHQNFGKERKMPNFFQIVLLTVGLCCLKSRAEVALSDLFPYGTYNGDTVLISSSMDDGNSPLIRLSTAFPFFNGSHTSLLVNINGAIFFESPSFTLPRCFQSDSQRAIYPFWSDLDLRLGGNIFYRQSTNRNVLDKAKQEIVAALSNTNNIDLKWAFITTWSNARFYGTSNSSCDPNYGNTFQSVLTTDGINSFAIFFYNYLQWPISGYNCTQNSYLTSKAGYDTEYNSNSAVGSCTENIIGISESSNYGRPGKWVFQVTNPESQKITVGTGTISFNITFEYLKNIFKSLALV